MGGIDGIRGVLPDGQIRHAWEGKPADPSEARRMGRAQAKPIEGLFGAEA